ncbi:MAG: radical SAM protein [Clostridia bacterium]|nr:radical SAM protein [Clostridia bacterium]
MIKINSTDKFFSAMAPKQQTENKEYRPFFYLHTIKHNGGYLVYNLLSAELIFLEQSEYGCFLDSSERNELTEYLINNRFLVPRDFDDFAFCEQMNSLYFLTNKLRKVSNIKTFTILPTTNCNARCFYCFEKDAKHINMSEETALKSAEYIINHRTKNNTVLRWFGGEPLCNIKAIDTICNKLNSENIKFNSKMTTNGYLFDEDLIKRAKNEWHLNWVQITLDGTEEVYNTTKAYVDKSEKSAFKRVVGNVENLLKSGIDVQIRMNMDDHNADDLKALTDYLIARFSKYDGFVLYVHLLFEDSCARIENRDSDNRHEIIKKQIELQRYIYNNLNKKFYNPYYSRRHVHCMADSNSTVMILPDGNLGKCQRHTDDHFWGSVYSEEINIDELNWYKHTQKVCDKCDGCKFMPMCLYPQSCESMPRRCDETDEENYRNMLENQMKNMYDKRSNTNET